jgi:3-oxoacyl-[acyl-carrier-protein] synthase II
VRGARPLAAIAGVASDRSRRAPGSVTASLGRLADALGARPDLVLSGATGVAGITGDEMAALAALAPAAAVHVTGDLTGHMLEAQAPAGVGLAAALVAAGEANEALVTSVGHQRGEGVVRVVRPSE